MRQSALRNTFIAHYDALLNAIATQNYDQLENLCEETLTKELAAQIYKWQILDKFEFRIVGQPNDDLQILNHFFVQGMSVVRSDNPCLSGYNSSSKDDTLKYVKKDFGDATQLS